MRLISATPGKWREATMFVVVAFLIWPIIASTFVGAYGLAFWVYFLLSGPPGAR
jgi:nitrate reductase NapE